MKLSKLYFRLIFILVFVGTITGVVFFIRSNYVPPILMYHMINERDKETKLSVCLSDFERQIKLLYLLKYNILTLEELTGLIKNRKPIPMRTVAITFDDGYEDNYLCAFPVLKKYNIPATIFIAAGNIGDKGYLNRRQMREMANSKLISIGSHTLSHAYLPNITDERRLRNEIFRSKGIIKNITGQKTVFFSYPVGGFNKKIRRLVIEAGYAGACATNPGKNYPDNDIFALKRLRISRSSHNILIFLVESSGFYTFIKEFRDEE